MSSNHPCKGCRYAKTVYKSPDGSRWDARCNLYKRETVTKRCADYPLYSPRLTEGAK